MSKLKYGCVSIPKGVISNVLGIDEDHCGIVECQITNEETVDVIIVTTEDKVSYEGKFKFEDTKLCPRTFFT